MDITTILNNVAGLFGHSDSGSAGVAQFEADNSSSRWLRSNNMRMLANVPTKRWDVEWLFPS